MKPAYLLITLATLSLGASCTKNTNSKIPHIALKYFGPSSGVGLVVRQRDTATLQFSIVDGDADLGRDNGDDIWIRDTRFPNTPFQYYPFPQISRDIEDPKKGLEAECLFYLPPMAPPRQDTAHQLHDTAAYEVYIMDRAGNVSNTMLTNEVIVTP